MLPRFQELQFLTPPNTMAGEIKLQIRQVAKFFESKKTKVKALENLTFDVTPGEFVCLIGPSGCGKSTLLSLIAGLDTEFEGTILDDGQPVTGPSTERVVMFQDPTLFPWLNVIDNIAFGLTMKGLSKRERYIIAEKYLKMVQLVRFRNASVHELSGGMKQRVALARALALDPEMLLMDEPFAALDAQTRDLLHVELQQIWATTHKTIVFVTHNVREAVRLGDRVLVMSARPGSIKREFKIDLPHPRAMEDHALVEYTRVIGEVLKEEVNRVLAAEIGDIQKPGFSEKPGFWEVSR